LTLVYQDQLKESVVLKALNKTSTADEVAYKWIDKFTLIAAPYIWQCDSGRVRQSITSRLEDHWCEL